MASLNTYSGPWTEREASHLLRRACYGANKTQIASCVTKGLSSTIESLFGATQMPPPPPDPETGVQWVDGGDGYDRTKGEFYYNQITKSWWLRLMVQQDLNIREKLTVFWSNHFATEMQTVADAPKSYKLLTYLRENVLKNFKDMARQVTVEEAMLRYLNGNTNTKGSPNENYARELQELFTIGKGPELSFGDYTNYTETDVREAARVLTGWREDRRTGKTVFNPLQHDAGNKQFSVHYQNTTITGKSDMMGASGEIDELIGMIFRQNATAEYIVRKFYIYFVNSDVSADIEETIIKPLADLLRENHYVVEPVLRKLLGSEHFFDPNNIGCQIRNPADLVVNLLRTITTWAPPADALNAHKYFLQIHQSMAAQQMDLNEPPSVAGWEAYYQEPSFYKLWLTTATLPLRNGLTDALFIPNRNNDRKMILDSPTFVKSFDSPADAFSLIDEANRQFFVIPFSEETRLMLAEEVLMDGGRYYEWNQIWTDYISNPNQTNTTKVRTSLDRLFKYMFRMAEFQLY